MQDETGRRDEGRISEEHSLILKHEDLVRRIAGRYRKWGELADLRQEGRIGLLLAIRSWTETGGASLRTYARLHIRKAIQASLRCDRNGKNRRLRDAEAGIVELSLDAQCSDWSEADDGHDAVAGSEPSPEHLADAAERVGLVRQAIQKLPTPQADAIRVRYSGNGTSLEEASALTSVPKKTLWAMEQRAIKAIRASVDDAA